jgi:hypothetical protein
MLGKFNRLPNLGTTMSIFMLRLLAWLLRHGYTCIDLVITLSHKLQRIDLYVTWQACNVSKLILGWNYRRCSAATREV